MEKEEGLSGCDTLCGSGSTDHEFADVSLVRDSTRQLTVVAGENAHIAFQNAKKGLMQFVGEVFSVFNQKASAVLSAVLMALAAAVTSFKCVAVLPSSPI